jgi:uncharacterized protein (DUF433 family)
MADAYDRIQSTPGVLGGKPRIRGTRIPAELIASMVADGYSVEAIMRDFSELTAEDIAQAVAFAAKLRR